MVWMSSPFEDEEWFPLNPLRMMRFWNAGLRILKFVKVVSDG